MTLFGKKSKKTSKKKSSWGNIGKKIGGATLAAAALTAGAYLGSTYTGDFVDHEGVQSVIDTVNNAEIGDYGY